MDSHQKTPFLNPVLAVPWNRQKQNYENPGNFSLLLKTKPRTGKFTSSLSTQKRNENIEVLVRRFPGLKKYEARAALTMSKNIVEKAIVLLEVSQCYHREVVSRQSELGYLKQIAVNLFYNSVEQDLTIRNVASEPSAEFKKENSPMARNEEDVDPEGRSAKVGIIIKKTTSGYKATTFDEK